MRKIIATMLAFLLSFSVMAPSLEVFAAEGDEAKIGDTYYSTLKEALEVGGEVELLKDVTVDEIINITKDTTLNLGDFTITNNFEATKVSPDVTIGRPLQVKADNFTIKANNGGIVIPSTNTAAYGIIDAHVSKLSIYGGRYSGDTTNGTLFRLHRTETKDGTLIMDNMFVETNNQVFVVSSGTFNTLNATITNSEFYGGTRVLYFDVLDIEETSTIKIDNTKAVSKSGPVLEVAGGYTVLSNNDWTVTGDYTGGYAWSRAAIGVGYEAVVTVKSGTYNAKSDNMKANEGYGLYIYTSGGKATIEGGDFSGNTAALRADIDKGSYPNSRADIIVNGGTFHGDVYTGTKTEKESITVNGGDFVDLTDKTTADKNSLAVNGGSFDKDIIDKVPGDKPVISVEKRGGAARYFVGEDKVNEGAAAAEEGDSLDIIQNVDQIEVPNGVEVSNNSGEDVVVNGRPTQDGDTIVTEEPSKVSFVELGDAYKVGDVVTFKVSTTPASYDENKMVKAFITDLTEEERGLVKLWYRESKDGEWYELTEDSFGPEKGFPFIAAESEFKAEFLKEGTLDFGVEIRELAQVRTFAAASTFAAGDVLASTTKTITISEKEDVVPGEPTDKPSTDKPQGDKPSENTPSTGDNNNIAWYISIIALSGLMAVSLSMLKRRNQSK